MSSVASTRRSFLIGSSATLGVLAGGIHTDSFAAEPAELTFGLTPVFLSSDLDLLARLRAYLQRATGRPVRLVTRRSYQEITALLVSGQLDAAWICGYPFVAYRDRLDLVATPLWRGEPLYRSYLIVDAHREAQDIRDLMADVHAFSDPDSNSGWLVTASELASLGFSPERFFRHAIFTWGHRNVIRAVAAGLAQSGSVDGYVYEVMRETEPTLLERTRILSMSEPLGFPPIACNSLASGGERVGALRAALLAMELDVQGREVLSMLRLDGFRPPRAGLYDRIADRVAVVQGDLG